MAGLIGKKAEDCPARQKNGMSSRHGLTSLLSRLCIFGLGTVCYTIRASFFPQAYVQPLVNFLPPLAVLVEKYMSVCR